jgi:hypothetical protein
MILFFLLSLRRDFHTVFTIDLQTKGIMLNFVLFYWEAMKINWYSAMANQCVSLRRCFFQNFYIQYRTDLKLKNNNEYDLYEVRIHV